MRYSFTLLTVAVAAVSAQAMQNYTSALDMTIDPNSVDIGERSSWCTAQSNTCDQLCDKSSENNLCEIETLEYDCTCSSNSSAPGLQYYTGTLPTLICKELFAQCIEQNANDQRSQATCKTNIDELCGTLDPADADTGSSNDDGDDDSSDSTTTASKPTKTDSSSDSSSTEDSGDFAIANAVPRGLAAIAAVGVVALLA